MSALTREELEERVRCLEDRVRELRTRLPVVMTSGYSHVLFGGGAHGFGLAHEPYPADPPPHVLRRITGGPERRRRTALR